MTGFGVTFVDVVSTEETYCGIRPVAHGVAIVLSTRAGQELEVFMPPAEAHQIAQTLLAATSRPDGSVHERIDPMSLPEAAAWEAEFGGSPDLMAFVERRISLAQAVAASRLLWPVFVVEQGCVLIERRVTSENLARWLDERDGDVASVEAVLSHVHLWDLFDEDPDDEAVSAGLDELAHVMATSWRCALAQAFPDREFVVEVSDGDDDYGPSLSFRSRVDREEGAHSGRRR